MIRLFQVRHAVRLAPLFILALAFLLPSNVSAQGPTPTNAECLACHSNPTMVKQLPSGEPLSLYVDQKDFTSSVHGQQKLNCVQCHTNISGFPHPAFFAPDRRDVTLQMYTLCRQCHGDNYAKTLDSIHTKAIAGGDRNAAVCTDCHTSHATTNADQPRSRIPQTCAQCHSTIYDDYAKSVHGSAVVNGGNADVPTCIDCHGVHNIHDPTTAAFRLKSPEICAKCHTDKTRMSKYNISTDVLTTYVSDFHGTTVSLFEKQSPDAPTNKPVCYDCHGIHNIKQINDPNSTVFRENLLKTCQRCHPNATTDAFAGSWMSHYRASPDNFPLVYYVNLFYWIFIPVVIGAMVLFILTDIYRRVRSFLARGREAKS